MRDPVERARQLAERVDAGWQRDDVEDQLARLHARQRRSGRRRAIVLPVLAAAMATMVVLGVSLLRNHTARPALEPLADSSHAPETPVPTPAPRSFPAPADIDGPARESGAEPPARSSTVLSLGDGSVVTPLGKDSKLLARQVSDIRVVVALAGGGARFDVPVRGARQFRAEFGAFAVETRGAVFRMEIALRQIEVITERGEVSVRRSGERRIVAAGQSRIFPLGAASEPASSDSLPAAPEPSTWRDDADRGDFTAAWGTLGRTAGSLERMDDLLLAGDIARLSGHPDAAVALFARAFALHPDDPRAPLAAFTLGRVQLEELGAPRDAALAFSRAFALAPEGPLAEDALAREVEAWSRCGELSTARAKAMQYVQHYPNGRRVRAVRRFGGLESR